MLAGGNPAASAAARRPRLGQALLEPVIASLTSQSSRRGVSATNVDRAMDSLMDSVFSSAFLAVAFPLEEDEQRYI